MKFKNIPESYIKVILDRLFRLKPAYERYERVFSDIINKFLIRENAQEVNISRIDIDEKISLAVQIFNQSVQKIHTGFDNFLNNYIMQEEERLFYPNPLSKKYLRAGLNLEAAFEIIKDEPDLKINLKQIQRLLAKKTDSHKLRYDESLLYPVKKILLCEGATEEILLENLCAICGYDFKKEGVYVLGAGGKNQVARKYYGMIEEFKIPVFVLLDNDAGATKELILPKLRAHDRIYVIRSGEFEDILPKKLITKALNHRYNSCYTCLE